MTDREQINSLAKKVSDYADETMKLKQENNALKERIAELESTNKKKRKFRAMTYGEFCDIFKKQGGCCIGCPFLRVSCTKLKYEPCKPHGKYILVEVKE